MGFTWGALVSTVAINVGICLLCFLIFGILRKLSFLYDFYHAKRNLSIPFRFRPPKLPRTFLSWMKPVFTMPDDHFVMCAGFDALTFVRFYGLCMKVCFFASVLCICIILPLNYTGSGTEERDGNYVDFDKTTSINIKNGSTRLWGHILVMAAITLGSLWLMSNHWKEAIKWRVLYFARTRKGAEGHTLMLRDIPGPASTGFLGKIFDKSMMAATKAQDKAKEKNKLTDGDFFQDTHHDVYKHDIGGAHTGSAARFSTQSNAVFERSPSNDAHESSAPGHLSVQEYPPPANINMRRVLANYEPHPPPTDFEPWQQAQEAITSGVSVHDVVKREFARDFGPHAVHDVNVVMNCDKLSKLTTKYAAKSTALRDMADLFTSQIRAKKAPKRKTTKVKVKKDKEEDEGAREKYGVGTHKVDKLTHSVWELDDLYRQIRAEEPNIGRENESCAAFVTARTRLTQSVSTTGLISFDTNYWTAEPAPQPDDVIWDNVPYRGFERSVRKWFAWAIFIGLVLLFIPIVAFLQQIINLDSYAKYSPNNWAGAILDLPVVGDIIKGILPGLALVICLVLVPIVLKLVAEKVEGLPSRSGVDFDIGRKFFLFVFVIVFLGNTLFNAASSTGDSGGNMSAGSESGGSNPIDGLKTVFENPNATKILTWVARSISSASGFFLSFILTKGLLAHAIKFLKLPGAIIFFIVTKISKSRRAKKKAYSQQFFTYGKVIPYTTLIFLLALTFATIQPFMPLFALMYFVVNYFYVRFDLLYAMREPYQTGGMFWPVLHNQLLVGIFTMEFVNLGYFITLLFAPGYIIMAVLVVITLGYVSFVGKKYVRPMKLLAIHAAADLDRADTKFDWLKDMTPEEEALMREREWDTDGTALGPIEHRYKQPALRTREDEHEKTMAEARTALRHADKYTEGDEVPAELAEEPYSDDDGDEVKEESRASKSQSSKKDKRSMRDSARDSKV